MRSRLSAVFALTLALTASGGATAAATTPDATSADPKPVLSDSHPCTGQPGFTCSMLTVPLDHRDPSKGTLKLQVATGDNTDAPKGVLLFLTGGPGQPGVPFVSRISQQRLPELAKNYRFVMIDQRGTGEFGAINCPKLQAEVGSSDVEPPSPEAVGECAGILGDRRHYYTSEQTTGDLDLFRQALGAQKITVDGVSYGSLTAARYAAAHPRNVHKVVLDSVLPHVDPQKDDMLYLASLRATGRVLRDACATAPKCAFDPAKDLAWLARHRKDHVLIWDMLVTYEFLDPTYRDPNAIDPPGSGDVVTAIHQARHGNPARLNFLLQTLNSGGDRLIDYSSGLHIATICGDGHFPWGTSEAPLAGRQSILEQARRQLPARATWPFTADSAVGNGFIQECLHWPPSQHSAEPRNTRLPSVPILLLNGDRDLSTPLEWAQEELGYAPNGKLVIVKGAAHSIQNRERGTQGREAVYEFLNG